MDYVKTIGEAFRWNIHKAVNGKQQNCYFVNTKHQLETTFYTGADLWKPPKGLRCR